MSEEKEKPVLPDWMPRYVKEWNADVRGDGRRSRGGTSPFRTTSFLPTRK